ncbi:MAG: hypothetical protein NTX56_02705 [Proteobacteria bacterium]|nr:hypothetical protein [Pseudomonadota bacterium]
MKYDILKDFKGSQDGRFTEQFTAGTQADLSDYLVSCLPAGHVRPVAKLRKVAIDNKAVVTDGNRPDEA